MRKRELSYEMHRRIKEGRVPNYDLQEDILVEYAYTGKVKYEDGCLVGRTYECKELIKLMGGKWDPARKGWAIDEDAWQKEYEGLKIRRSYVIEDLEKNK